MHLVFDIGGTNMRLAISKDGQILDQTETVPTPKDFDRGIYTIKSVADKLSGEIKIQKIAGGIAGPVDRERTKLISSPHIPQWVNQPFKQKLEEVFDAPVILDNDCKLIALGEATAGAGKDKQIVAYLGIGTGVGGARIVNNKIDENALGFEPGHQIIVPDGNLCNCTGKGHLEAYVGGGYFEKIYGQKGENIKDPKIWDEVAKYLAIGVNNTIVHWSPDIVVLGGSVMKSLSIDLIQGHLKQELTIFPVMPEIIPAQLEDSGGLYGALQLLKN